ncbi:hypothetical protein LNP20_28130 [Klebsiella pneumoniae subsp. pneumoniae]|nr:hypothetical protein [Klebsiella pneumoniae subsp. pneumoniae]
MHSHKSLLSNVEQIKNYRRLYRQ